MTDTVQNNKRIAKNTLLLYFRTLVTLILSLYSSRLILKYLGIEDYGIYNVVGGVVGMFTLLSGSMTAATQRFISYELGKKDGNPNFVFSATLTIHFALAAIVIVLAETIGLWFLNEKLVIPFERIEAANWVFQFSIFTFFLNIISIPYNGLIIAYERMDAFAMISIVEALLKFISILALYYCLSDKLIVYSLLMFIVAFLIRLTYIMFCKKKFNDVKYSFFTKSPIYRNIFGFTGWNFLGSSSGILSNQGINILMNLFFGVIPNAARGIATQVDNALQVFVSNLTMAINPQITKSYAAGDIKYAMNLVCQGGKLCFFLFFIGSSPIIICTQEILELWLNVIPNYAVLFVKLSLIYILIQTWSQTLYILMLSCGDIKKYQIIVGGISLLSFPITWISYKIGLPVESCYYVLIGNGITCLIFRLIILHEKTGLDILFYLKTVIIPSLTVVILFFIEIQVVCLIPIHWILLTIIVLLIAILNVYYVGLNSNDRKKVANIINSICKKILKR